MECLLFSGVGREGTADGDDSGVWDREFLLGSQSDCGMEEHFMNILKVISLSI